MALPGPDPAGNEPASTVPRPAAFSFAVSESSAILAGLPSPDAGGEAGAMTTAIVAALIVPGVACR